MITYPCRQQRRFICHFTGHTPPPTVKQWHHLLITFQHRPFLPTPPLPFITSQIPPHEIRGIKTAKYSSSLWLCYQNLNLPKNINLNGNTLCNVHKCKEGQHKSIKSTNPSLEKNNYFWFFGKLHLLKLPVINSLKLPVINSPNFNPLWLIIACVWIISRYNILLGLCKPC